MAQSDPIKLHTLYNARNKEIYLYCEECRDKEKHEKMFVHFFSFENTTKRSKNIRLICCTVWYTWLYWTQLSRYTKEQNIFKSQIIVVIRHFQKCRGMQIRKSGITMAIKNIFYSFHKFKFDFSGKRKSIENNQPLS